MPLEPDLAPCAWHFGCLVNGMCTELPAGTGELSCKREGSSIKNIWEAYCPPSLHSSLSLSLWAEAYSMQGWFAEQWQVKLRQQSRGRTGSCSRCRAQLTALGCM